MSVILQPQAYFPIVRQIANHLDTDTYYVRAVVRNAEGVLVENVDLTDQGSQRFQKKWRVPADGSGQGTYISIVTSVYTDSGYTTKSSNYGDEETTYLIFDRVTASLRGGGGNGVDAYTVRQIVTEAFAKLPTPPEPIDYSRIPKPERYEMRWDEILTALEVLRRRLEAVESKETDLTGLESAIAQVQAAVTDKPVTPETDLSPVLSRLDDLDVESRENHDEQRAHLDSMNGNLADTIKSAIAEAIKNTKFVSQFNTFAAPNQQTEQPEKPQVYDLKKLAS